MTLPKKGFRKITVDDVVYKYKVTGADAGIQFIIVLADNNQTDNGRNIGQIVSGYIDYFSNIVADYNEQGVAKSWSLYPRAVVTPKTIHSIILFALKKGWQPTKKLKPMWLKILSNNPDETIDLTEIDLTLKQATEFPILSNKEVAVAFKSVHWLKLDFIKYEGEGNIHHKFNHLQDAERFIEETIKSDNHLTAWILKDKNTAIKMIQHNQVVNFDT